MNALRGCTVIYLERSAPRRMLMNRFDISFLSIPILTAVVSVPMLFGLVPPNGLYGFRTKTSMASPELWYASNRLAAIYLLVVSTISVVFWFACKQWVKAPETRMLVSIIIFTGLLLCAMIAAQAQILALAQHRHTIQKR